MKGYDRWKTTNEDWECEDEDDVTLESKGTTRISTARKDRVRAICKMGDKGEWVTVNETYIRKGDKVMVTSYFTYEKNGPRTGYHHSYTLIAKGPNWDVAA